MFSFDMLNGKDLDLNSIKNLESFSRLSGMIQNYYAGFSKYANEFTIPYLLAMLYFKEAEQKKFLNTPPLESFQSYLDLLEFNMNIFSRGFQSSMKAITSYNDYEMQNAIAAVIRTFFPFIRSEGENIAEFIARQAELIKMLAEDYPQAILDIEPEYGFHFERGEHELVAETERFYLYQVAPLDKKTPIDKRKKPLLIIPPFVLGANILAFLPHEGRSYAHCFANCGIPTYIRIMKNIETTDALQLMTPEDDCLDTKYFCEKIVERNAKPVTLNGYCQGGYMVVCNYLSGQLDDLVDALITCVSPMDGTRSDGLAKFLNSLPERFRNLAYGTKTLPNGNKVADGKLMGWVYKLKSIEHESPVAAYYRDLMMFGRQSKSKKAKVSKTAAAINFWLNYERTDLPMAITQMSFDSYNTPITKEGTLPVKMFDRELNLKRIEQKGIKWLICYGINDDLVEKETALAPLDYVHAEVSAFPKGHVAIATSWALPTSECSLHSCFGENCRGPVRFHTDLDREIDESTVVAVETPLADINEKSIPLAEDTQETE
ncbi:MAG: metal transporter [Desulfobacterales bacterium]